MNDTQSMARQRGGGGGSGGPNQNFGSQRQGSFGGNSNNIGGDGYDNNINQFNGPPPNNYNSYSGGDRNVGSNYPMNNQTGGGGVKRENLRKKICFNKRYFIGSMSVSFTMKIRGVPFEAGEKEVFEVREMSRELHAQFQSALMRALQDVENLPYQCGLQVIKIPQPAELEHRSL
jgi:hypothetical protein